MPGLLWVVILLPLCWVTLHLQFTKSGLLLQYHSCPMHVQQPVSYFTVKCFTREWKKPPLWPVHCGNPTLHTIGHMHDYESGIFWATRQRLVAWDKSAGRSRASSKESILFASINIFRSDLGIAGIEYLVSVSAHPYYLDILFWSVTPSEFHKKLRTTDPYI